MCLAFSSTFWLFVISLENVKYGEKLADIADAANKNPDSQLSSAVVLVEGEFEASKQVDGHLFTALGRLKNLRSFVW